MDPKETGRSIDSVNQALKRLAMTNQQQLQDWIETEVQKAFLGTPLEWYKDTQTNTVILRVLASGGMRWVDVTETFLEADDGAEETLRRLESWNLKETAASLRTPLTGSRS